MQVHDQVSGARVAVSHATDSVGTETAHLRGDASKETACLLIFSTEEQPILGDNACKVKCFLFYSKGQRGC